MTNRVKKNLLLPPPSYKAPFLMAMNNQSSGRELVSVMHHSGAYNVEGSRPPPSPPPPCPPSLQTSSPSHPPPNVKTTKSTKRKSMCTFNADRDNNGTGHREKLDPIKHKCIYGL